MRKADSETNKPLHWYIYIVHIYTEISVVQHTRKIYSSITIEPNEIPAIESKQCTRKVCSAVERDQLQHLQNIALHAHCSCQKLKKLPKNVRK